MKKLKLILMIIVVLLIVFAALAPRVIFKEYLVARELDRIRLAHILQDSVIVDYSYHGTGLANGNIYVKLELPEAAYTEAVLRFGFKAPVYSEDLAIYEEHIAYLNGVKQRRGYDSMNLDGNRELFILHDTAHGQEDSFFPWAHGEGRFVFVKEFGGNHYLYMYGELTDYSWM